MSLQEAYLLAEQAEKTTLSRNYLKASELHKKAAIAFQNVLSKLTIEDQSGDQGVTDPKVKQALQLLASQHQKKSLQLNYQHKLQTLIFKKSKENAKQAKKRKDEGADFNNINFTTVTGKNNILESLANKRGQQNNARTPNSTGITAFIGEYSIINESDNNSILFTSNGKAINNDVAAVQQTIMSLFSTLEIRPTLESFLDEQKTDEQLPETNIQILSKKTKEELVIENQQLKSNLLHLNKAIERLNLGNSKLPQGSNDIVLIDKRNFQKNLATMLAQISGKQGNTLFGPLKAQASAKSIGGNSPGVINNNGNSSGGSSATSMQVNNNSNNNNLLGSAPNNPFSHLNPMVGSIQDQAVLTNQLLSEKESEINRLQQTVRNQERQLQRLTKSFKISDKDKNQLIINLNNLKREYMQLQQRLSTLSRRQNRTLFNGLQHLNLSPNDQNDIFEESPVDLTFANPVPQNLAPHYQNADRLRNEHVYNKSKPSQKNTLHVKYEDEQGFRTGNQVNKLLQSDDDEEDEEEEDFYDEEGESSASNTTSAHKSLKRPQRHDYDYDQVPSID